MAKRRTMTNADYLAIAISPALIMALVGSLVFFLIEVLYVGEYQGRLNYAFALFVFAAVLIARISIEMGADHAALFALPLGVVMFLFMLRFVEQPNIFGHVINVGLLGLVWWCAHRLTWDSTVIDDEEDASGEGLMQRFGVDGPAGADKTDSAAGGATENELFASPGSAQAKLVPWWQQPLKKRSGPHMPGLWVLYFSLAALPLFGIGQHWIPEAETARRRYVFALLLVYVAAALSLLVTTSFLNLRRYLRQRNVEMPLSIAGTWVGIGAALIVVVMLIAALIPRPGAEIALSRVPWQRRSSDDLRASQISVIKDGAGKQSHDDSAKDRSTANGGQDDRQEKPPEQNGESSATGGESDATGNAAGAAQKGESSGSASDESGDGASTDKKGETSGTGKPQSAKSTSEPQEAGQSNSQSNSQSRESPTDAKEQVESKGSPPPAHALQSKETLEKISSALGELSGVLKIVFYAILALLLAWAAWEYRDQIVRAIADVWNQLRGLFGGKSALRAVREENAAAFKPPVASFRDFHDPFTSGRHRRMSPEELVRYSFAAFEAWANDHGRARTPDCTPYELVMLSLEPESAMYDQARQLVRLYGEMAYASRSIPRKSADELATLWQLMRSTPSPELMGTADR